MAAASTECLIAKIQENILQTLHKNNIIDDTKDMMIDEQTVDQQVILGVLNRLVAHEIVEFTSMDSEKWILTKEGQEICQNGSYEAKVFNLLPADDQGMEINNFYNILGPDIAKIGLGKAFANKWITQKTPDIVVKAVSEITDTTKETLENIKVEASVDPKTIKDLKKRKLINKKKSVSFSVRKGTCFSLSLRQLATDLTHEIIKSDQYKQMKFKEYNFNACGLPTHGGSLHPLLKVREEFRQIFLEMGFSEMPTNRYVESSFWNFDALFQPQQHPSRDAHDTFFLKSPKECKTLPAEYMEITKETHENGGFGSIGHRCNWSEQESKKNILRTHTTAISSQVLYNLAQQPTFTPSKFFSIDKVFRNETLDATHLAEFHQIEGFVVDYNLTLGDLMGIIREFFRKLGMTKMRFKPAFNPYTEPSMEVFAYHDGLGRWIEVGNSGVFRPEMLRPMGFDADVTVIAWGLSLERPTMIKYGIPNIRDLFGHKVDLSLVQSNPICRFDKH